ncbi:MAG: polymer-forming cytoskeletal protein [Patescibacteria group bacterium]|nr:polymer-forming cytoskeletal protein [Patescibacteria group bacterium]
MSRIFLIAAFLIMTSLLFPANIFAQGNQNISVLPQNEVVNKDYFASGNSVTLAGTVNGDAYLAGGNIINEGTINGDLLIAGGTVDIRGNITGNVRVVGGQVTIGLAGKSNLSVAAGSVNIVNSAKVGGSAAVTAGSADIAGPIGKEVNITSGQTTISSSIGGDVNANGPVTLTSTADIGGNFDYLSSTPAQIQPGAKIAGKTTQHLPPPQTQAGAKGIAAAFEGAKIAATLVYFISYLIVGLLMLYFMPIFTRKISDAVKEKPWASLGIGILVTIITPIVVLVLLVTILAIPLALILLAFYLIAIFLSKIFVSLVIGQKILGAFQQQISPYWALVLGLVIYAILTLIPVIGIITSLVFTFLGLGALFLQRNIFSQAIPQKSK